MAAPAQDEEFVLSHCDNVQATGFVEQRHPGFAKDIEEKRQRVLAALKAFDEPLVLLLGGRDKKLPWGDLAAQVRAIGFSPAFRSRMGISLGQDFDAPEASNARTLVALTSFMGTFTTRRRHRAISASGQCPLSRAARPSHDSPGARSITTGSASSTIAPGSRQR